MRKETKILKKIVAMILTVGFVFVIHPVQNVWAAENPLKGVPKSVNHILSVRDYEGCDFFTKRFTSEIKLKASSSNKQVATVSTYTWDDRLEEYYQAEDWYQKGKFYHAGYEVTELSPGTADIILTAVLDGKTYSKTVKYRVEKYKNPFSKFTIGNVNYKKKLKECRVDIYDKDLSFTGKVSIKAKSGYKIESIYASNRSSDVNNMFNQEIKSGDNLKEKYKVNFLDIKYKNTKTGATGVIILNIADIEPPMPTV